ncbi:hypothetical protein I4I73_29915 [Pseudonocardia sp. KRD-184]|uniref:Uncharacterized protein n=1 Tax=Pseudonocardia oceani TaxID=2792013 RepID=A0ABS6UHA5_9PSEU|nr:hypothetical protein [Pseudonocardia oceani]MBW0093671.1 hypothetical protein [Pseudonocardia oceani]MBW0100202.1 hypothetical protein [Pseudonocardia oceani]MBW0112927.1 hypothetical protein [Pseudonocardia oceani]MBW0123511.1 hypothetical protein [Pseudonocardia oceani]MBW0131291.1 hypothetical protein [Pseudonocardia oceani]
MLRVGDLVADLVRVVAAAGVAWSAVAGTAADVAVFAVVVAVVLVPRLTALPRPVDAAVAVTWVVAGWANVLGLYVAVGWIDIPVHATTPGATAAAVYLLLARAGLVAGLHEPGTRRAAIVVVTTAVGTTLAVWWEFYEWIVYHGAGPPVVGYGDTVLDLLMGTLSSAVAGLGLALWSAAGWGTERLALR